MTPSPWRGSITPNSVFRLPSMRLDPEHWRDQVLRLGLLISAVIGVFVYVPSVLTASHYGQWGIVVVDTLALATVAALYLLPQIPYKIRATTFSLVLYLLGAWLLVEVGPISQVYLLGFSIIATLLLGIKVGLAAVALNALTLMTFGVLGFTAPEMFVIGRDMDWFAWVVVTMNFLLVNIVLVVAVGTVLRALEGLAQRAFEAREELENERAELVAANEALEEEMAERARAEAERTAVETRLAATLESMTDAFYMLDHEWRFTYINREAEHIMRRPREELLGKFAHEEYPKNAAGEIGRRYRRAMREKIPISFDDYDESLGIWYELRLFPTENGLAVYFRDVTERKSVQAALEESEHRFRTVFNQQFQFMAILSPEGRVIEVNDLPLGAGGLTREEVVGKFFWETGWWKDLPEMRAAWPQRLEKAALMEGPLLNEDTFQDRDGAVRFANSAVTAVHDADGKLQWFIIQATDITEQRKSEEAARRGRQALDMAGQMARLAGWRIELPDNRLIWSDELYRILEFPVGQELALEETIALYEPESFKRIVPALEALRTDGSPFDMELRIRTRTGRVLDVRAMGEAERDAAGGVVAMYGAFQDISDIKQSQEEREALARRLTATLESINDAFFTVDREWRFTFLNREAEKLLRRDRGDLLGKVLWEEFPGAVGTESDEAYHRAVRERVTVEFTQYYPPLEAWLAARAFPTDEGLAVYFRDVTEQKRAEQELHSATDLLERTFESLDVAVLLVRSGQRTIVRCNPAAERVFGYAEAEMLNKSTEMLHVDRSHYEEFGRRSERVLALGQPYFGDYRMRRKDGEIIETQHSVSPLRNENGEMVAVVSMIRDITREKRAAEERSSLEDQLRQSQKMEAVGRLAGGVAHDFNNMLSVIIGHAELMEIAEDLPEECREDVVEIKDAARRSADLTRQLLAFARKQTIDPKLLDINATIESMLKMLRRLLGEDVELLWKPGLDTGAIMMDPAQIDQILVNLIVNARDAVDSGGRIVIETKAVTLDEDYAESHLDCVPGPYVAMRVSDNGCGMDKDTLSKLFEPFFTTKPQGKGTGLGLPTVYGIVQQNGGVINVYSEPGKGSTFSIYLPRVQAEEDAAASQGALREEPVGTETVLLVEDEQPLLALGERMLTRLGYRVMTANRPSEALRIATEFEEPIDLLVTDVVMPEMNGLEVYQQLLLARPALKCLFMSGYTADVIAYHGVLEDGLHFIQKPFTRGALGEKIRAVLNGQ